MYPPVPAIENSASRVIGTILKHDRRVTSYKLALVRALNDVVLSFPDVDADGQYIAVPYGSWRSTGWLTTGPSLIPERLFSRVLRRCMLAR